MKSLFLSLQNCIDLDVTFTWYHILLFGYFVLALCCMKVANIHDLIRMVDTYFNIMMVGPFHKVR